MGGLSSRVLCLLGLVLIILLVTILSTDANENGRNRTRGSRRDNHRRNRNRQTTPAPLESVEDSNCTSNCSIREMRRMLRIEHIKADILRKLNLDAPVNITNRTLPENPVVDRLRAMYDEQTPLPIDSDDDDSEETSTTLKVLPIAEPVPEALHVNLTDTSYFRLSRDIADSHVQLATLGVYIRRTPVESHIDTFILISQIQPPGPNGIADQKVLIFAKQIRLDRSDTGKWYLFPLTDVVRQWISSPGSNYGLQIVCRDSQGHVLALVDPRTEDEEPKRPYLEVSIRQPRGSSRRKRMLNLNCHETQLETRCCRYPLAIDFESLAWDFIIVPKSYAAYYCSGECPFGFHQKHPRTIMYQQVKHDGGPCCSPERMSPISLIYYDSDLTLKVGKLNGMVVERCNCAG